MRHFLTLTVLGSLISLTGIASYAYTPACVQDQVMKNVTCGGSTAIGARKLAFQVVLEKSIFKQNPQALPSKLCTQLGPVTDFSMYIRDSSNGRTMGFFSKFGSNHAGAPGDKPDTDALFNTGLLSLRAYAFDYGDFVNRDQVIFATASDGVHAKVSADLRENTGEPVLAINAELNCIVR